MFIPGHWKSKRRILSLTSLVERLSDHNAITFLTNFLFSFSHGLFHFVFSLYPFQFFTSEFITMKLSFYAQWAGMQLPSWTRMRWWKWHWVCFNDIFPSIQVTWLTVCLGWLRLVYFCHKHFILCNCRFIGWDRTQALPAKIISAEMFLYLPYQLRGLF